MLNLRRIDNLDILCQYPQTVGNMVYVTEPHTFRRGG
jgi:hypothetical protein